MTKGKKPGLAGRWISLKSFSIIFVLFLVSVFCMYVSATSAMFYRPGLVAAEFLVSLLFAAVLVVMIGNFIFHPSENRRDGNEIK